MLNSSMNPRASAPFTPVLSEHSLTFLTPLLRSIAMWHRERTRVVPLDQNLEFDDIDVEDVPDPETPTKEEFERALNDPYAARPAALSMTQNEIEAAIATDQDPWAEPANNDGITSLREPPIAAMLVAARFAALLSNATLLHDVSALRAFSLIAIPDRDERKTTWKNLGNVLQRLADLSDASDDTWRGFDTPVLAEEPNQTKGRSASQRADFDDAVEAAVKNGHKVLALVPDTSSISALSRAMCGQVLDWPILFGQMIIEILGVTHTATGKLSENALAELLPPDNDIAALPLAVFEGAFLEETTFQVARSIANAAKRFRALPPSSATLNDIVLNEKTCAPVNRLVSDIASWKTGQLPWTEVSSSILFYGPPGNGKTLLASAIAGSLNIPLIATSYSDCQKHGHQGDLLNALSGKVENAVRSAPCVFFLDELDSFTHRERPGRHSDYIVGVVNGLLEHLARLNDTPGVVVLGATNYPDMIDPAVTRPGRFDRKLEIKNPDRASILNILELTLGNDAKNMPLPSIADQLLGSSGAQIAALVREARGLARAALAPLSKSHLETAATRICPALDPSILWRIAVHEAGHLVVAHALELPSAERAAITHTGGFVDIPSLMLEGAQSTKDRIAALLGGRAAEQVILGKALNGSGLGANSDLELATRLAAQGEFEWGLGDQLAFTPFNVRTLPQTKTGQIDKALKDAQLRAIEVITNKQPLVLAIAQALVNERELSANQLQELFS